MSAKNFALIVLACLVKDAFYADAAPSITRDDLTAASKTVDVDNRVLTKEEYENEVDVPDKTAFENFIQGLHNIDSAMEAMIDNYTDGVEHLSEENALQDADNLKLDKMARKHNDKSSIDG
uniref:ACYPI005893 protein n=1 Tax=Acyrthosiphon pisum TaxID=7029 RepID=C4WTV8_ACYPI|nr:ACYPI005893 [Acyrthosiphon pisum]